jgi:hypothetical protein
MKLKMKQNSQQWSEYAVCLTFEAILEKNLAEWTFRKKDGSKFPVLPLNKGSKKQQCCY